MPRIPRWCDARFDGPSGNTARDEKCRIATNALRESELTDEGIRRRGRRLLRPGRVRRPARSTGDGAATDRRHIGREGADAIGQG